jgi:UDP-N-acetylmuramoylalanine--D-glutamate ligase
MKPGLDGIDRGPAGPLVPVPALASVLGAARSGLAVSELLLKQGYRVYLSDLRDDRSLQAEARRLTALGAQVTLGHHDRKILAGSDFLVVSPGMDERTGLLREPEFAQIPVFSEIEVGYWFCPLPIAAITGTNGKTTTTALLGEIVRAAGIPCQVAGNIGRAISRAVLDLKGEKLIVAEISSFQLHTIKSFHPRVGVLLNLSPDHLERYSGLEDYYSAKLRLFLNMGPEDTAILNADNPETVSRAAGLTRMKVGWFGFGEGPDRLAFVKDSRLFVRTPEGGAEELLQVKEFGLPGRHNVENLLAAAAAATALGIEPGAIRRGALSFVGLPHRLEQVAAVDGVTYINDSKATTVDSVLRALESYSGSLILIMGGRHKGAPYTPLASLVRERARGIVVLGEAAELIASDLEGSCKVWRASSLEEAVTLCRRMARPGDTVLLSPGCSSFDMFTDYEDRGNRFKQIVRRMATDGVQS